MKRIEIIDFLKGYSIFTIMIFHFLQFLHLPSLLDQAIRFGGTGVHLFILLSGLGLYYSHLFKPLPYAAFLKKRLLKVYVPYILVVLLSALISVAIPIYKNSLYALGGHIFLYKMIDENIVASYGYQLWFISTILQFYFAFYFIIWIKEKLGSMWFLITAVIISIVWAIIVYATGHEDQRVWNSSFFQFYWEFALGMIIAEKLYKNEQLIAIKKSYMLLIAIICCALYGFMALKGGDVGKLFNDFFALTGYSLLAICLFSIDLKPIRSFFLYIGNISFPVYLLHILILLIVIEFIPSSTLLSCLIALILVFPISSLYQNCINGFFKFLKL